ncbi:hypothetical protein VaNZ11_014055, partial [Volvox africanus]
MPKPKRRNPVVHVPKAAVRQSVSENSQTHTRYSLRVARQEHVPNAASGPNGGCRGKRSRKGNDADLKHTDVKRRKIHVQSGPRRWLDGADRACSQWRPLSVVHKQAAFAVQRLLEADSSRKHGASLKSLTLAPHIEAKKATFAVTCQVLKFSQILERLDEQAELTASEPKLGKYVVMVLLYELLRGQGLERKGPAERAVLASEPKLRAAMDAMLLEAGVKTLDELLAKRHQGLQSGSDGPGCGGGGGLVPEVPHPRWVRVNLLKANLDDVIRQLDKHLQSMEKVRRTYNISHTTIPHQEEKKRQQQTETRKQQKKAAAIQHQEQQQAQQPQVVLDTLLPDLLALPPGTDLHDHPLVTRGSVVLQSKASCMPARALNPEPGWTVVDCCAAPGNKTTHLAAMLGNKGRVLAFDKDPKRLVRLRANAALTGASCIEARLADFLSLNPTAPEFREVRGVLLDPSCSGSGTIFTRMDHLLPSHRLRGAAAATTGATGTTEAATATHAPSTSPASAPTSIATRSKKNEDEADKAMQQQQQQQGLDVSNEGPGLAQLLSQGHERDPVEAARVAQLARFQAAALSHALRFPSLERLVYSTCSVHVEENEAVVAGVLQEAAEAGLELADPFPSWHRRGLPLFPGAEKLVRTDAYQDGTDGFFVALFQRRQPDVSMQEKPKQVKRKKTQKPHQRNGQRQPANDESDA